jgi:uncharacterized protein (DUF2164 family)
MTILHERLPAAYYRAGARRAWAVIAAKLAAVMAGQPPGNVPRPCQ